MTRENLAEKYRPISLDDIVGQLLVVRKIKNLLATPGGLKVNLLLIGPPGSGKTSATYCIAMVYWKHNKNETINGFFTNDYNDNWTGCFHKFTGRNLILADIRGEITRLTQYKGKRIIFIDETDGLSVDDQEVLTTIMEGPGNVVFILSSNYEEKIQPRIKSRCVVLIFHALKSDVIYERLVEISVAEVLVESGASPELDRFYKKLAREAQGDLRRAINELESFITDGELDMELVKEYLGGSR